MAGAFKSYHSCVRTMMLLLLLANKIQYDDTYSVLAVFYPGGFIYDKPLNRQLNEKQTDVKQERPRINITRYTDHGDHSVTAVAGGGVVVVRSYFLLVLPLVLAWSFWEREVWVILPLGPSTSPSCLVLLQALGIGSPCLGRVILLVLPLVLLAWSFQRRGKGRE